ncbi:hypothetical protein [Streptomyces hyaluromycini]|uniref:hypothetical protein n=1 Tax=Streptomyces hyaluromycini TaxID=1377993 RepID=UPI0011AE9702|nr:hypothetical protein [Streptomyces hyaluromycini]
MEFTSLLEVGIHAAPSNPELGSAIAVPLALVPQRADLDGSWVIDVGWFEVAVGDATAVIAVGACPISLARRYATGASRPRLRPPVVAGFAGSVSDISDLLSLVCGLCATDEV